MKIIQPRPSTIWSKFYDLALVEKSKKIGITGMDRGRSGWFQGWKVQVNFVITWFRKDEKIYGWIKVGEKLPMTGKGKEWVKDDKSLGGWVLTRSKPSLSENQQRLIYKQMKQRGEG